MRVGVLLPHFGPHSTYERLIDFTPKLEGMGFSSVWVRDNLGFTGGHAFEERGDRFVDPFLTLGAIAARTTTLKLGTATIIPIRPHAITAQLVGSLAYLAPGRLVIGVGAGNVPKAFELSGFPISERYDLVRDMVGVLRATSEPHASYKGATVELTDATIAPHPPADLPIWYGGSTNQSVDRALEYADGWMPGRCPMPVFDDKLTRLREGAEAQGRTMSVSIVPVISLDKDRESAVRKVNVEGLLEEAKGRPAWKKAGPFDNADSLEGILLAGSTQDLVDGLNRFAERKVDELVLDFRLRMDGYEDTLQAVSEEVLPHVRA
jgi:alkanesulfonate monooxygenase SsuD/methylene tetrahydromethanopterin reductase-like flavin-dependent oxidoreductase (luciferase family)